MIRFEKRKALDDVMGARVASARDDLSRAFDRSRINMLRVGEGEGSGGFVFIPIPREATSVATMMGLLPVLNSFRTQSRSFCCLSP